MHQSRQNKTEKQSKINDQICCVRRIGSLNMLSFGLAIGSLVSCSWQWWMDGWMVVSRVLMSEVGVISGLWFASARTTRGVVFGRSGKGG